MSLRRSIAISAGVAAFAAVASCNSEPFGGITDTISASIITPDTTLFVGQNAVFVPQAVYGIGPGFPQTIQWAVSDESKIAVSVLNDLSGNVRALDTGVAWVYALINQEFLDSAMVTVVAPGLVRWRATVPGPLGLYPAADTLVWVGGMSGTVASFELDGTAGPTTAGACSGFVSPSVAAGGTLYFAGTDCTRRHATDLGVMWTAPVGDADAGVAIAANGDAVVLHSEGAAIVVSRLAALTGQEVWRDTLKADETFQRSSPAIAANNEIYVAWRGPADSSWLTRIGDAGTPRWTVPLPNWPRFVAPAVLADRVLITYTGGISVFDTAGNPLWSRQFSQDNPASGNDVTASSPVVDRAGNVYIQTAGALHSYTAAGAPRWTADSLRGGNGTAGIGAPALLLDTTVVVTQGGNRVCGVVGGTGVPRWCSPTLTSAGDVVGSAAVGSDRTIFVTRVGGDELIAIWNNTSAESGSWSTDGANHQRTRRR